MRRDDVLDLYTDYPGFYWKWPEMAANNLDKKFNRSKDITESFMD